MPVSQSLSKRLQLHIHCFATAEHQGVDILASKFSFLCRKVYTLC